ncbi:MAG: hypothetical protein ACTSRY_06905, partial [Alphaproteobacteria bacterium]
MSPQARKKSSPADGADRTPTGKKKQSSTPGGKKRGEPAPREKPVVTLDEHIVEIVSDSGEGAQRCGQSFG